MNYQELILASLLGETPKEKFDYLQKLIHDRETYRDELAAVQSFAGDVKMESGILGQELTDVLGENQRLSLEIKTLEKLLVRALPYIQI